MSCNLSELLTIFPYRHIIFPERETADVALRPANESNDKTTVLHVLQKNQLIPIDELAQQLDVSSSTLRRELRELINESLVTVTVGKVSLAKPTNEERPFALRSLLNSEEKVRIARMALELVQNGDTIFIAGGTTTLEFARLLPVPTTGDRHHQCPARGGFAGRPARN